MTFGRGTRVFTIVGELVSEAVGGNGIRVDDASTATGNHSPNTTLRVEDRQFERSTSRSIELLDVRFFLGQVTTERSRPDLEQGMRIL